MGIWTRGSTSLRIISIAISLSLRRYSLEHPVVLILPLIPIQIPVIHDPQLHDTRPNKDALTFFQSLVSGPGTSTCSLTSFSPLGDLNYILRKQRDTFPPLVPQVHQYFFLPNNFAEIKESTRAQVVREH
jgi:hypothetical protein